jgi:hypothetical protein
MSTPKKILLIYHYYHHHEMVEKMARLVSNEETVVDVFCWDNYIFVKNSELSGVVTDKAFQVIKAMGRSFLGRLLRRLFGKTLVKQTISKYDLVDFHAFAEYYLDLMHFCVKKGIPYDITLWGSEIMRATPNALIRNKYGFENARYIKATENLQDVISEQYLGAFDNKCKTVYWGNSDFEVIDKVSSSFTDVGAIKHSFIDCPDDKIIITCGYNGSAAQNHVRILESISRLPETLLNSLFLILPMTYGADEEYLKTVKETVERTGVLFKLFDKRLPIETVAKIRIVSDVVVNMQDSDAFSGSLQGHLYGGNVLIIGEWLKYPPLDNKKIFYLKTTFDSLSDLLEDVLCNLDEYKKQCINNSSLMSGLTSWNSVVNTWFNIYKGN